MKAAVEIMVGQRRPKTLASCPTSGCSDVLHVSGGQRRLPLGKGGRGNIDSHGEEVPIDHPNVLASPAKLSDD